MTFERERTLAVLKILRSDTNEVGEYEVTVTAELHPLPFLHPLLPFPSAVSSSLSPGASFVTPFSPPPAGLLLSIVPN